MFLAMPFVSLMPGTASAATGTTVTRSFSTATPTVGAALTVTLAVNLVAPDSYYAIDEVVPAGWVISNPGTGDTSQAGHIKWVVIMGAASTNYSYTVTVPGVATGVYTFAGSYGTDSIIPEVSILGPTTVTAAPAPVLTTIAVSPATATSTVGTTQQFTAAGLDQFGAAIATTATWTSSNITVATIDAATGLATAVAPGIVTITATDGAVSGTATLVVQAAAPAPVLTFVIVTPSTGVVKVAAALQMHATGLDQNGTVLATQPAFTWASSDPTVASISVNGLVTGLATGTSTITAVSGLITGTALITVSTSTVLDISDDLMKIGEQGALVPEGNDDYASSTSLTATHDVHITLHGADGDSEVDLPNGVKITREDGSAINGAALVASSTPLGLMGGLDSLAKAAFKWGLVGYGLQFTMPVTIKMYVGAALNGQTLHLTRSITGTGSWTNDGIVAPATCLVTAGQCTFQATKASYYVASEPAPVVSSGGGGGGGASVGGGGSSGGSISLGNSSSSLPSQTVSTNEVAQTTSSRETSQGQVLGASTYEFTKDLSAGSRHADVKVLQQMLLDEGYSIPGGVTGYFGSQTRVAVMAYQKAHGIAQTGYVGRLTRAELSKGSMMSAQDTPSNHGLTESQVDSIIAVLQSFQVDQAILNNVKAALGR